MNYVESEQGVIEHYFGMHSRWLALPTGEKMHYIDEGAPGGDVVIFVHGSAAGITAAANFYLNIPPLVSKGFRVLAPDLWGYGLSEETPDTEIGVQAWTRQIVTFMDMMQVEKAWLVGNSLGGRITPRIALEHPERVLGNVVIGNGGALWPEPRFKAGYMAGDKKPDRGADSVRAALEQLVTNPAMVSQSLVKFRTWLATRPGAEERYERTTMRRNATARETLLDLTAARNCPVPTLVIYGREDHLGPPENALACAEAFPNADLVVFGHCGHWTMVERAEDFNHLMLRFFGGYADRVVRPPVVSEDLRGRDLPSIE